MVWGAISYYGTCEPQFASSKMYAITYKGLIEKAFQHFDNIFGPIPARQWTQSYHKSSKEVAKMCNWSPYSLDLNIIENVWTC